MLQKSPSLVIAVALLLLTAAGCNRSSRSEDSVRNTGGADTSARANDNRNAIGTTGQPDVSGNGAQQGDRSVSDGTDASQRNRGSGQPASGTASDQATGTHGSTLEGGDDFVQFAAMSSMAEIELGQLARQRAMSQEVKQFAQRMVTDHTKASAQLQKAMGSAPLPKQLDAEHRDAQQMLTKMKGADFDREYMRMMVDDHRAAVARFQAAAHNGDSGNATARNGSESDTRGTSGAPSSSSGSTRTTGSASRTDGANGSNVQAFAGQTLPTLQEHLRMAEQVQGRLK